MGNDSRNWKLCYVDFPWAYFTTAPLSEQWGDDWNDAPYEHNAGEPYEFHDHDAKTGRKEWHVCKLAFDGDIETPGGVTLNSQWSVQQINAGDSPWLLGGYWSKDETEGLHAGASVQEFTEFVWRHGGRIYSESNAQHEATALERSGKAGRSPC